MEMQWFHNALRIMMSIDRHELETSGITLRNAEWYSFRSNPYVWFIRANDNDAAKIWQIIVNRQQGK